MSSSALKPVSPELVEHGTMSKQNSTENRPLNESGTPNKPVPANTSKPTMKGLQPSLFNILSWQKIQAELTKQCSDKDKNIHLLQDYIEQLEELLKEHNIDLPPHEQAVISPILLELADNLLKQGTIEELQTVINRNRDHMRNMEVAIEYHDLTLSTMKTKASDNVVSISTILKNFFFFWNRFLPDYEQKVLILNHLTGRILPRKMTLLIGPPGSGKSVFLKALTGRLNPAGKAKLSGEVYYDGDNIHSPKFITGKVADYIEQGDTHDAVLTVEETLKFAWECTSGGHHAYSRAKDEASAEYLNRDDANYVLVQNVITALGLRSCKDTYVGNQMIRGVSGGQKRRVTLGEIVVCPRPVRKLHLFSA
jgi:ABC-type transport system involved in cytochrome c biogenesis ATPase subunit